MLTLLWWSGTVAQQSRICLPMQGSGVRCLGREDPLRKEMVTHSSTLACKIPQTEEPGGLRSMALKSRTRLGDHTTGAELTIPLRHYETSREDHSPAGGPGMAGPCTWLNRASQTLTAFPLWVSDIRTDMCPVCNAHHLWSTSHVPVLHFMIAGSHSS